jgi:hypothetical protein
MHEDIAGLFTMLEFCFLVILVGSIYVRSHAVATLLPQGYDSVCGSSMMIQISCQACVHRLNEFWVILEELRTKASGIFCCDWL